jgi:hypothetical protein
MASSLCVLTLGACTGGGLNLAQVKGKVLVDGQPATVGTIAFTPDSSKGTKGPPSGGQLDVQGEFTLIGVGGKKGAMPGFYKVTVSCPFDPATGGSSPTGQPQVSTQAGTCKIPAKYGNFMSTDLTAEVIAGKVNDFTFELKSQ